MRDLTYFMSDLHLGAGYIADHREHELKVVNFLRSIEPRARRLILLGDILDYWWEYRDVVPRGYTRFFGELARLADNGVEIIWFKGNHDVWIFDYLPSEIGMTVHDGIMVTEMDGARFLMEHGDGVGRLPWTFRRLRSLFRCRVAQRMFAAIHPRWTVGFAHAWSSHSRKKGGYVSREGVGESLVEYASAYNENHPEAKVDYFIFGHLHVLMDRALADGARVVVLGDWISRFSYAVWDGKELTTHIYEDKI
ncbi:UDP-2,3-diacylglucosamine diphosphatase [uncultured Duncaniella sp.]|uniref:UDP-2,3-diacylglucosamine diphosphatase n=1 Tax=uncultured Duncaniella sp. TaxID=2768039 RepID=UPI002676D4C9|nr:UDP-2,3-diacylglucosamine diphosphatase [uncultured Duncaniella sp.]MCI9172975.1 UDP-2,3-diacylglucosamine diphosphatase [Muribaculaceae bacterium]